MKLCKLTSKQETSFWHLEYTNTMHSSSCSLTQWGARTLEMFLFGSAKLNPTSFKIQNLWTCQHGIRTFQVSRGPKKHTQIQAFTWLHLPTRLKPAVWPRDEELPVGHWGPWTPLIPQLLDRTHTQMHTLLLVAGSHATNHNISELIAFIQCCNNNIIHI